MATVAERIKILRESAKLSQSKIGALYGVKQSSVNRYENALAEAPYETLLWYADYFDVSMDYIFGRTDKPQGKLYDFHPKVYNEDVRQFIEMCFDPKSPMSDKLKQTLFQMMSEDKE